ncbi:Hypothetical protein, putative [Bodo saltans]|uniref:Uncharacterized protein n=1 Tax=Bodo saltans TaxID=75058 RepID=A0A0S4JA88_BODSA|nr:Hypothetical protein, putative [Bodo saltans]|eukprot:CUG88404.1 Hypothetical protein, putative [Bodo saltans]
MIHPRLRVKFVIAICVLSFYFGLSKFSESSLTLRQLRLSPESTPNEPNSTNANFIESNSAKPNSIESNSTEPSYNVLPIADTEADAVTWQLANQALPVPKRASEGTKLLPYERELLEGFPPAKLGLQIHRPTHSTDVHHRRHQIAVVFFGLVKKVVAPQFAAFRDFVAAPLLSAGEVDVFLHTFEESNFSNPRNGEKSQIINQSKSIGLLRNAFSGARRFNVAVSESKEAHDFFWSDGALHPQRESMGARRKS